MTVGEHLFNNMPDLVSVVLTNLSLAAVELLSQIRSHGVHYRPLLACSDNSFVLSHLRNLATGLSGMAYKETIKPSKGMAEYYNIFPDLRSRLRKLCQLAVTTWFQQLGYLLPYQTYKAVYHIQAVASRYCRKETTARWQTMDNALPPLREVVTLIPIFLVLTMQVLLVSSFMGKSRSL